MENITLETIQIASPCPVPWSEMEGDDRKRFCEQCHLNVFNISEMNRSEAETFLQNAVGKERVCVTLFRRADGTILTQNCPIGLLAVKRKFRKMVFWVSSLVVTSLIGIGLYQKVSSRGGFRSKVFQFNFFNREPDYTQMAGEVCVPTPAHTAVPSTTGSTSIPESPTLPEEPEKVEENVFPK